MKALLCLGLLCTAVVPLAVALAQDTAPAASAPAAAAKRPAKSAKNPTGTAPAAHDRLERIGATSVTVPLPMSRQDIADYLGLTIETVSRTLTKLAREKVLVIVPWKKADLGDLSGKPLNSLVDDALQPLDREVFRREIDYHSALAPDHAKPAPAPVRSPDGGGTP